MAKLYDIEFTTKKMVKKLDDKGNVVSEDRLDNPIKMTALPHKAAMAYSGCDNFKMEEHVPEARYRKQTASGKAKWGGAATKSKGARKGEVSTTVASTGTGKSKVQSAAERGDLSAAVNQ